MELQVIISAISGVVLMPLTQWLKKTVAFQNADPRTILSVVATIAWGIMWLVGYGVYGTEFDFMEILNSILAGVGGATVMHLGKKKTIG